MFAQEAKQKQDVFENEIKVATKQLEKERQQDADMLGKMVEGSHKKMMNDIQKRFQ